MIEKSVERRPAQAFLGKQMGWHVSALLLAAAGVLAGCSSAPKDDPNSQASLDKLYAEAKDDLNAGAYDRAIKSLERIEGRAAGTLMAQQAQLDLVWANYKSGERAAALTALDRFIKLNPSSPALDYALYMKGIVNFNEDLGLFGRLAGQDISERDQQAARDAMQAFNQVVEQFPDSNYAPDAKLRVDYITNTLATYEVHVARYYYNRSAYIAAANRAQRAVADFPKAPSAEEALHLMVMSYEKLGLEPLRDDAQRVLKLNFPQSAYVVGETQKKAWWKLW
jgi:outer membrane protein assembly factor BamD